MKKRWPWVLLSLLLAANAHAQLYKWVDANGKISYSDTPPPPSARKVEEKTAASGPSTSGLPYELAQAVKTNPVTLYTMPKCPACDDARSLLNTRGIPFTEKTVNSNEDIARLHEAGGDKQLPFVKIGRNKQSAFEAGAWNSALTAAGYPQSSQLPKNYKNPAPEAAAPKAAAPKAESGGTTNATTPAATLPAAGNAPPGFRF